MSVQQRRQYDPEFKNNAVLLTEEPDRSVRAVADSLGISVDLLYQWRQQYRNQGEIAFPGLGNLALSLGNGVQRSAIQRDILTVLPPLQSYASHQPVVATESFPRVFIWNIASSARARRLSLSCASSGYVAMP